MRKFEITVLILAVLFSCVPHFQAHFDAVCDGYIGFQRAVFSARGVMCRAPFDGVSVPLRELRKNGSGECNIAICGAPIHYQEKSA